MRNAAYVHNLSEFLNTPLDSGDDIFERFASLPNAIIGIGSESLQRFAYIPGKRKDRVVLVAHIDTIWDKAYQKTFSGERSIIFEEGIFRSSNPECGIGADCRAGCAMLWELQDCGHSLLIVDGEEHGKHGARFLKKCNHKLFRELNRHCFMIEFDWKGTDCCLFNQVDNTKKFKNYIENDLGFIDSKAKGGTDLQVLCQYVCGVNLGVGFHGWHTSKESLVLTEWANTLEKMRAFLEKPQQRFRSRVLLQYIRYVKMCANKVLRILKIKK